MDLADVQTFLKKMNSPLLTYTPDQLGEGANGRTAAQIIYDASRGTHVLQDPAGIQPIRTVQISINPMVILVKLEKEQSLIRESHPDRLDKAMGYNCPDYHSCPENPFFKGFARQVEYGTASLAENYQTTKKRGYSKVKLFKVGSVVTISSEVQQGGALAGPSPYDPKSHWHIPNIRIGNAATSVLYTYTPWVYQGNYNFWLLFNNWFRADIDRLSADPTSKGNVVMYGSLPVNTSLSIMDVVPDDKKNQGNPTAIVMHYLGLTNGNQILTARGAADYFRSTMTDSDDSNNKRVQYVVAQDGTVYQLITDTTIGAGALGFNTFQGHPTISIENEGHFEDGVVAHNYTTAQLKSNAALVQYLILKYQIPLDEVISHMDVDVCKRHLPASEVHRTDPGTAFMDALFKQLGETYRPCT
jgi:hypothetical protein